MDKKNDTAQIITIMAGLAAFDPTGVSGTMVLLLAAAVVMNREF